MGPIHTDGPDWIDVSDRFVLNILLVLDLVCFIIEKLKVLHG